MIGIREGLERVSSCLRPVQGDEELSVWEARGRVLAGEVRSPGDYPPLPKAEYDGYALRSRESPGEFRVVGSALPGSRAPELGPGEAIYVTTGAYLPGDLDAVIPQEDAEVVERGGARYLAVARRIEPWSYVDPPGYHARRGELLLPGGRVLTRLDLVALASVGVDLVRVRRRVRVTALSVGSELSGDRTRAPSAIISEGGTPESNSVLLSWYLEARAPFAELVASRVVPDDPMEIAREAEEALSSSDVLVTFGGSGPGSIDFTRRLVEGSDCSVGDLRMKPGKPAKLAVSGGRLLAVLPGHPLAALHALTRLLDPLIHMVAGAEWRPWPGVTAVLAEDPPERRIGFSQQYLVRLSSEGGERVARIIYKHGTGVTSKLAGADALLNLDEWEAPRRGDRVEVALIT
ncbi:MAG: molybdopterin molybdotransferase MoeA [Thaumarchaeota archaeon]|nr:molybdopterin molybdotransferase MoeA [Nitrososphaerota archaeon]